MKADVKYFLISHPDNKVGYFLNNKLYSLMFEDLGYEAELKDDGYVYDVKTGLKSAQVVDSKYIRLSDGVEFLIKEST